MGAFTQKAFMIAAMSAFKSNISLWHFLAGLWPLLLVFGLAMVVMRLTGNTGIAGIPLWLSAVDMLLFVLAFGAAAVWSYLPMMRAGFGKSDFSVVSQRSLEHAVAWLPERAVRAFFVAGSAYASYLVMVFVIASAVYDAPLTGRMLASLTSCMLFGVSLLAPALALMISTDFAIRVRKWLSMMGGFSSGIEHTSEFAGILDASKRPWALFVITSLIPGSILAFYVYLILGSSDMIEQRFIMSQALVLFVALFLGGTYLVYMTSRIVKRVTSELATGLEYLRQGQFDGRVAVLMDDDMGSLARGFNTALEGLKEHQDIRNSMQIAAEIQQGLLPASDLDIPQYSLHGRQQSCHEVGGDFYDYISLPDGRYWFIVADVSGKGYPAALTVANLQSMLRTLASLEAPLEAAATYVNQNLCSSMTGGRFVTVFMGELRPAEHQLVWINAGHVPPLCLQNGTLIHLEAVSPPMGLMPGLEFDAREMKISPNDLLLSYTDGVTEARGGKGSSMFGEARLQEWLMTHVDTGVDDIVNGLMDEVSNFSAAEQSDDITILCLKRDA